MTLEYEILIPVFFLFLWLTCAFEAFDGLSGGRIRKLESKNEKLAKKLDFYLEHDDSIRAVLKILQFVAAAVIGGASYLGIRELFGDSFTAKWAWLIIILVLTVASGLCEIIARFVLFRYDILILRVSIPPVFFLASTVFLPLSYLLNAVTKTTGDWHKNDDSEEKVSVEDEILSYVESYGDDSESDLEEGEKQMIRGILDLGDMSVREIMTPRIDLDALPSTASIDDAKKAFIESGHSRIPVYGRSIDEIKGIIYAKDFIDENAIRGKTLLQLAHKAIFIPETKEVAELLEEIKRSRNHFAVIIDEYGGTSGIVTFEDIIEEIVGEVHDEYDTEDDLKNRPQLMADGTIVLDARTLISDINEIADTNIPDNDDTDTFGGYICSELGRIPEEGETFTIPGQLSAFILKADKRRILQLKLRLLDDEEDVHG